MLVYQLLAMIPKELRILWYQTVSLIVYQFPLPW